jgi:hypothetical protein
MAFPEKVLWSRQASPPFHDSYRFEAVNFLSYHEKTRQRAQALGPHAFFSKLTTDSDLRTAIETALAGHPD